MSTFPLRLSDSELDIVMRAAAPLDVNRRDAFLQAVASALMRHQGELGEGVVYKTCAELQRQHFDAPFATDNGGKYNGKFNRVRRARSS
jgi:hypothetical protein